MMKSPLSGWKADTWICGFKFDYCKGGCQYVAKCKAGRPQISNFPTAHTEGRCRCRASRVVFFFFFFSFGGGAPRGGPGGPSPRRRVQVKKAGQVDMARER